MQIFRKLALASLFAAIGTVPAAAAWHGIGQVRFGTALDHRSLPGAGRPVRALQFTARNNAIYCRSIRAHLQSGRTIEVFSGRLPQGRRRIVDLPGGSHVIRSLSFRCRATHNWAYVEVAADTRRGDDDRRGWNDRDRRGLSDSGLHRLPHSGRWQRLGSERFEGRRDREIRSAGRAGRLIDAIALRPVDDDARCRSVVAEFRHGEMRPLDARLYGTMRRDRYYVFDLPGRVRNLVRLHMVCRAVGDRDVRIEIYSRSGR